MSTTRPSAAAAIVHSDCSKLRAAGRAREGDDVADVAHTGDELDDAFEAEAEAGVRYGAEAARVEIPLVVFFRQSHLADAGLEFVEALLPLAAADDLADLGSEDVHGRHG